VLQPSLADADPKAAVISDEAGLHPNNTAVKLPLNTGGAGSDVQFAVLDIVVVLPQASVAVNVLICVNVHPDVLTAPSLCVIVGEPQASDAVAVPNAALIAVEVGLHPRITTV